MASFISDDIEFFLRDFKRKWGKSFVKLVMAFVLALIGQQLYLTNTGQGLDLKVQSVMYAIRGARPVPPEVVLVAVDDTAYATLKAPTGFPLPRKYIAEAFEQIASAHPKLMIIDGRIEPMPDGDANADSRIEAAMYAMPTTIWSGRDAENFRDASTVVTIPSDDRFRRAAKRELPMTVGGINGTLCFVAWSSPRADGLSGGSPVAQVLREIANLPDIETPGPFDFIDFYGPHLTIQRISIADLIVGDVDTTRASLKDKIILFGYQSRSFAKGPGNSDRFDVPVSALQMYGVEIHANIVGNILEGRWLSRLSPVKEISFITFIIFALVAYALRFPNWRSLAIVMLGTVALLLVTYLLFAYYGFWLGGVGVVLLSAIITVVVSGFYFIVDRDRFERIAHKKLGFRVGDE